MTTLFPLWLRDWKKDTQQAMLRSAYTASDASYKGAKGSTAAFIAISAGGFQHNHFWPCSAHSSFDGELTALYQAIQYAVGNLNGHILIIADNSAALQKAIDLSNHSGFPASLQIAKLLDKWFKSSTSMVSEPL